MLQIGELVQRSQLVNVSSTPHKRGKDFTQKLRAESKLKLTTSSQRLLTLSFHIQNPKWIQPYNRNTRTPL